MPVSWGMLSYQGASTNSVFISASEQSGNSQRNSQKKYWRLRPVGRWAGSSNPITYYPISDRAASKTLTDVFCDTLAPATLLDLDFQDGEGIGVHRVQESPL